MSQVLKKGTVIQKCRFWIKTVGKEEIRFLKTPAQRGVGEKIIAKV